MHDELTIDPRFRGPPTSANGGYTCGLLARRLGARAAEVTLRRPPPLERPLAVTPTPDGLALVDGDALVAEAIPAEPELDVAGPVGLAEAAAVRPVAGFSEEHPFPSCFVCGPERSPGDGLRIFSGPVPDRDGIYAASWTPEPALADAGGRVREEVVWAALDCPTAPPVANRDGDPPIVLARMAARVLGEVEPGRAHVLVSWSIGVEGRKRHAAAALYSGSGELLAWSRALWIELSSGR